jgi:hypothetical protein
LTYVLCYCCYCCCCCCYGGRRCFRMLRTQQYSWRFYSNSMSSKKPFLTLGHTL